MANRSALARCFAFFCIISVTSFMLWFSQESTAFNYGKILILSYDLKSKETLSSNSTIHNNTRVRKLTLLNTSISSSAVEGKSSHVLTKCYMPEGKHFRRVQIDVSVPNMQDIQHSWKDKNWVQKGGTWMPTLCKPWRQVAIIVPYRNRYQQLKIFFVIFIQY
ncbi:beta-1,4-galactosyltransferase 6-like isoform X2 [Xenia sp. Carnegie-2017]|uniref:beta-1,4-galactosyltransferase 6-like isoform X2 n=1 Tax=Xenia sp. Carnegie-2017 TaxID=2897299 RepID=UPI001F03BD2A|nr:beta-1,4-galactosyltransferase 6-like isoform X2 [Xenia sp. Carnegie-2017]